MVPLEITDENDPTGLAGEVAAGGRKAREDHSAGKGFGEWPRSKARGRTCSKKENIPPFP